MIDGEKLIQDINAKIDDFSSELIYYNSKSGKELTIDNIRKRDIANSCSLMLKILVREILNGRYS